MKCQYCDKDAAGRFTDLQVCEDHEEDGIRAYIDAMTAVGDLEVVGYTADGEPLLRIPETS